MGLKDMLKETIEGTGEVAESLISAVTGVVKEGTEDLGDVFGAVIDLGKEGVVDVTEGVKGTFVGAVNALKESGKTTEEAVAEVTTEAEAAIAKMVEGGVEGDGEAAKKGVEEAKSLLAAPFAK